MDEAILKLMRWRQAGFSRSWLMEQGEYGGLHVKLSDLTKKEPELQYYIGQMAPTAQCCDYIASEVAAAIKAMEERENR